MLDGVPDGLGGALSEFIGNASRLLAESRDEFAAELQQFYFDAISYTRLAEVFGSHSMIDVTRLMPAGHDAPCDPQHRAGAVSEAAL